MKKIKVKFLFVFFISLIFFSYVNATEYKYESTNDNILVSTADTDSDTTTTGTDSKTIVDNIFKKSSEFFQNGEDSQDGKNQNMINELNAFLFDSDSGIYGIIKKIGYIIFAFITVILGVKYIWSGVDEKSRIKETIPLYIVGILFFFLADGIVNIVFVKELSFIAKTTDINVLTGTAFKTLATVANTIAIISLIIVGLTYMFSAADQKANIKTKLLPIVIGLIFIFSFTKVMDFVISSGGQIMGITENSTTYNVVTGGNEIGSVKTITGNIWSTFSTVAQTLAIAAIVLAGIKYMFSPADKKSDIKMGLVYIILGGIFVFASVAVAQFIVEAGNQIL